MVSDYRYKKAYIIGSGQLAFLCAEIIRGYISDIQVFELKVTESTVLEKMCIKNDIKYRAVSSEEMKNILLDEEEQTFVVSAASIYLIPKEVISKTNYLIINWHNALLPKHRGRNAECWAIYSGDKESGITWHLITEDIDEGAVIKQAVIAIDEATTAMSLYKEQILLGETLFDTICKEALCGRISVVAQEKSDDESIHYAREIPNNGILELSWDMKKLSRFLRAMDYGSLQLLGKMRVDYEEKKYEFYRYSIQHVEEYYSERVIEKVENKVAIKEHNTVITLKGLKEM